MGSPSSSDPSIGLCARCRWLKPQKASRGNVFYRCLRADDDDRFMQYPPIPVLRCVGFEPLRNPSDR